MNDNSQEDQVREDQPQEDGAQSLRSTYEDFSTDVPPDETNSTANIYVHGLSVLCPDRAGQSVDIGFFSHGHTPLTICVEDPDGVRYTVQLPRGAQYQVRIEKQRPRELGRFYLNPQGHFNDPYDFRWMVAMKYLHPGDVSEIRGAAIDLLSAVVGMKDVTFFTKLRSRNNASIDDTAGGPSPAPRIVGRLLGGTLTCDPGDEDSGFVVAFRALHSPTWTTRHFPKRDRPYLVSVETLPTDGQDHMPMLYRLLSVNDANDRARYSIRYTREAALELCCGGSGPFFGDRSEELFYAEGDEQVGLIPPENKVEFSTKAEGLLAGYAFRRRSDQYACQPFPDGDGPFDPPWS